MELILQLQARGFCACWGKKRGALSQLSFGDSFFLAGFIGLLGVLCYSYSIWFLGFSIFSRALCSSDIDLTIV